MKKAFLILITIMIFIVTVHYYSYSYDINYSLGDFEINEIYNSKNKIISFNIEYKEKQYYFEIGRNRFLQKKLLNNINLIEEDNIICILADSKKIDTYPLCYENDNYVSYLAINSEVLNEYKHQYDIEEVLENFKYFNNLNKNEYVALWKYNGFYIMNGDNIKTINLFKKDRYNIDLAIIVKDKIIMPNYDESQYFKSLIVLDITTGKHEMIEGKYDIYYDSYFAGNNGNNIYLFDNKTESLYEINIKKQTIKLISNEEKGYIKLENNKKVEADLKEYTKNKITYFSSKLTYEYENTEDGTYKKLNNDLLQKLSNNNISIFKDSIDNIYYSDGNYFYNFNNYSGIKPIFYDFELNFNSNNRIFVYIK